MIISIVVRYVERIPTIKDLIKRLRDDIAFKWNCGFLVSDSVPSEASYSRLVTKLMACDILETEKENISYIKLSQKVLFRMILLLPMPVMLKPVIKHHQKKDKPTSEPKKRGP